MTYALRFLILLTMALLGGLVYSLAINFLIIGGLINAESASSNFGYAITQKAVFVWIASVILGLIGVFLQKKSVRIALFACPLLAPSIFALIYALSS